MTTELGLKQSSLLALNDLSDQQVFGLVDLAIALKGKKLGHSTSALEGRLLAGKNVCLIFEKASTRTRCAAVVAVADEGGQAEYLGKNDIHLGKKESVADTARVLGRMFDGILFRGYSQSTVEGLAAFSGIPVWNGLTDEWHPSQILADLQTAKEAFGRLRGLRFAFVGDGRNNVCNSLMVGCAKVGIDFVNCCPQELSPSAEVVSLAAAAAARNGCVSEVSHDPIEGVRGANVLYTDVWVSMGEESQFQQRLELLRPFQVDMAMADATGNLPAGALIFLHCLPAFHNHQTEVTRELGALEVTDDVFEAPFSKVFDQAENRMHTLKAIMTATMG
ncbi:MAG: ornithine carbamoyltransferase [Lentisphaerae bacterium]|nr:ornithine carbamoyltransferase [Lentisphaerota bacterium]MBT4821379.1 ornithine carbamoyltransferase [Lentisphaerota bacterium]MBT5610341.1 ornithine carbamoyltransferase [Lentisphaerota bacterium]MBT7056169.1 ornithine carbamoyltransferase [Lentisphaerota bacterium]MBT7841909.1 ornithine carbamoyltransferase [Lentisphaerota bacterium]